MKDHQFEKLADTIHCAMMQKRDLGTHIQHLGLIHGANVTATTMRDYVTILMRANNLRKLSLQGGVTLTALAIASQTCITSLSGLDLFLVDSTSLAAFKYVGIFPVLQALRIEVSDARHLSVGLTDALRDVSPWKMDYLHTLTFIIGEDRTDGFVIKFLVTCALPSLRVLHLNINEVEEDLWPGLAAFCSRFSLQRISLNLEQAQYPYVIPGLRATYIHVGIARCSLIENLPQGVKKIGFTMPRSDDEFAELYASLDELRYATTELQDVCIFIPTSWRGTEKIFCWMPEVSARQPVEKGPNEVISPPRLLWYAASLAKTGINLRDGRGKTVADYFV
jgi:hypothetical protein